MASLVTGAHPVLDQQAYQGGSGMAHEDGLGFDDLADFATPRFVAGLVLGAVATLVLLRVAGFRFSFGVNVG